MSTKRKIDSARANGAKSHGPATAQGRKKSSMNALKYGLTARTVVLPNENDVEYTFLLESYVEKFQPADPVEMDLVVEMVNAKWRQRRLLLIESNLFEEQMQKQKEEIEADYESYNESVEHACAFRGLSESGCVTMLSRAESRLERTYSRALRNLLQLRHDARKQESEKRTQSQTGTPSINTLAPPIGHAQRKTAGAAAISGVNFTEKFQSGGSDLNDFLQSVIPVAPRDSLSHTGLLRSSHSSLGFGGSSKQNL
jgi:hypothetical protein